MIVDEFGQVYYSTVESLEKFYNNDDFISQSFLADHDEINKYNQHADHFEIPKINEHSKPEIDPIEYHQILSNTWNTPDSYANMDITQYLLDRMHHLDIHKEPYISYLYNEIESWHKMMPNPIDLWKFLKFFIDTCKKENIVTGLGRGSSVASLVLFLLEIHQIDPIKYNLDYNEFLR